MWWTWWGGRWDKTARFLDPLCWFFWVPDFLFQQSFLWNLCLFLSLSICIFLHFQFRFSFRSFVFRWIWMRLKAWRPGTNSSSSDNKPKDVARCGSRLRWGWDSNAAASQRPEACWDGNRVAILLSFHVLFMDHVAISWDSLWDAVPSFLCEQCNKTSARWTAGPKPIGPMLQSQWTWQIWPIPSYPLDDSYEAERRWWRFLAWMQRASEEIWLHLATTSRPHSVY